MDLFWPEPYALASSSSFIFLLVRLKGLDVRPFPPKTAPPATPLPNYWPMPLREAPWHSHP